MSDFVKRVSEFATKKHIRQVRDVSTIPYITHPRQVAEILSLVAPMDENLLCAGWLHDTIEDCGVTWKELSETFNKDIADLVLEVTKEKPDKNKPAIFPHLKTQRGYLLKFADRLSNLSNMKGWPEKKREWYMNKSIFWKTK